MATNAELKAEYLELQSQMTIINVQISNVLGSKNKKYSYSNQETTHMAEMQSLTELFEAKRMIREQMTAIEYQLTGVFVQIKN